MSSVSGARTDRRGEAGAGPTPTSRARARLRGLKTTMFRAAGELLSRERRGQRVPSDPARILVLQLQQIGDSTIFTPTLRAIRARYPNSRIDLLVNPVSYQFYKKCPYVAQIHVAEAWRPGAGGAPLRPILPLLRRLRRERYDLSVTCLTQQSFKYGLVAFLAGAPVRVGFDIANRGFLNTIQLRCPEGVDWVRCNLEVARALGADVSDAREEAYFDDTDARIVDDLLAETGIATGAGPLVAIHTGANWQSRTWYQDRWAALADALVERYQARIAFVGSRGEAAYVDVISGQMRHHSTSLLGRTDIPQLAALLRRADLFVGTDSGPRQIAGAMETPHVVLMSSQDDTQNWVGFRKNEIVIRSLPPCRGCFSAVCGHKTCMDLIGVADALGACDRLLHARGRQAPQAVSWA